MLENASPGCSVVVFDVRSCSCRWGSPADALVAHGCLPLRTLWLCVAPTAAFGGARASSPLYRCPPFRGFVPQRPGALPRLPPRPLLTARPPPSRGGAGPAVLLPAVVRWACGGSSGLLCVCGCHVVRFVSGYSLGPFPGAAQPHSYCRAFPLACAQGWVYP